MDSMNFALTEDQEAIRDLVDQILKDQVTENSLKEIEEGDSWLHTGAWQALAEAQILGLALPEDLGGGGLGLIDLMVLLENAGRYVAPIPVLESILGTALTLARYGSESQKKETIPGLIDGSSIIPVTISEPAAFDTSTLRTTATKTDSGWELNGQKTCVSFASVANAFLIPAQTDQGIGLFLVDKGNSGLDVDLQRITTDELAGELTLKSAMVSDADLVGAVDGNEYSDLIQRYMLGICAIELGAAQRALELTASYARERKQFGVAICNFQAVAQRAADAFINVEALKLTFWQAAWRLSEGQDTTEAIHVAKYWASEGGNFAVAAAQHIHGGMGFDRDYPLFRYYLLSRKNELTLGGASHHIAALGSIIAKG